MLKYKFVKENQWIDVQEKLKMLRHDIASATAFVREIEQGNLDVSIGSDMSDDDLKASLASMRDQMKTYSLTEKQRNWVNEGLAKFVQILRSGNNEGRQHLSDNIIRNLVTYLKANQGALFALNDDDPKDVFLQMEACYAYDRKKYLNKRIELGEGLAGQVVLEKSTLYMTDVPKDFIKITSGLGEALPRNILLVPLKLEEKIYGVVELASFQVFQPYEIEFVEKLGESIASAVAEVKNSDRTNALLKETQLQAEQLRAQEEEVRQNIEELSATQETMQRALNEVEYKEFYLNQLLNTSQDLIYTVDREFRLITWNKAFADEGARRGITLEKGVDAFQWYPDYRKSLIPIWERALNGETFQIQWDGEATGKKEYYLSTYAPLRAQTGEIVEAVIYAKDITPAVEAQQETERLLNEAQQQAEELKAQEEELRQNMEELSATQEAMEQKTREVEYREEYLAQLLSTTQDLIFTVDQNYKLVTWNKSFADSVSGLGIQPQKGMTAFEWRPDEERLHFFSLFKRVFNGESFESRAESRYDGTTHYFLSTFMPLKSKDGDIIEAVVFAKDITPMVVAQQESERLLKESQQQTESLQSIQEELDRKNKEIERARILERDRTDALAKSHKKNMLNLTTRFKELENQYKEKIDLLEKGKQNGHKTLTKN